MAITGKLVAAALLLVAPSMAAAEEPKDPVGWLQRMTRSAQDLDYDGRFVYRSGTRLQSLRILHSAGPGGERERLVALSGPLREVIRDGDRVACLLPGNRTVLVNQQGSGGTLPLTLPSKLADLKQFYAIRFDGDERVAGTQARKVAIRPKDAFRYGHNYWIAGDSGLLVRAELLDAGEQVIEEVVFTSLTLHDRIPPKLLEPSTPANHALWRTAQGPSHQPVTGSRWRVEDPPPGFRQVVHRRGPVHPGTPLVEQMVFSDGLATVSIFIESAASAQAPELGLSKAAGALNARAGVLGEYRVTVMGEVPAATVERMMRGIEASVEGSP